VIGLGLLILITHRNMISLNLDFEFQGTEVFTDYVGRASGGNEYVLGSGLIIDTARSGEHQWGARWVIKSVVRVVPRQLWPSQYQDAYRFFGVEGVEVNQVANFEESLGWNATGGAGIALLAEFWWQLWWLSLPALFAVGWLYGRAWYGAVETGGLWILIYVVLLALSVFLVAQGMGAMLFRLLWLGGAGWFVWQLFVRRAFRQQQRAQRRARWSAALPGRAGAPPAVPPVSHGPHWRPPPATPQRI
jgi:hypothetical protein